VHVRLLRDPPTHSADIALHFLNLARSSSSDTQTVLMETQNIFKKLGFYCQLENFSFETHGAAEVTQEEGCVLSFVNKNNKSLALPRNLSSKK
jgi:hypothetical protein